MSARQNKKRRGNLNRARTLTIQDIPDLQQSTFNLAQTIAVAAPLTSPFPVASSPGNPAPTNGPHTPSSPSSFPPSRRRLRLRRRPPLPLQRPPHSGSDHDSYPLPAPLRMQHPQQAHFVPDPALPRGQGDLEALERLKETIKSNQHEIFRATPRLDVLASLYQGSLGSLLPPSSLSVPPHPEQMQSNPAEKAAAATTSSGGSFETVSSSGFSGDARHAHAHAHAPVQGVPLASGGPHPGISGNMVPPSPRDQSRNPSNGRAPMTPSRHSFRSPSVEHSTDVNGAHSGPNPLPPSRTTADSTFAPREQPSPGKSQRISQQQHQMLTSPEGRRPGADNDRTARAPPLPPPAYPSEHNRERPPLPPPSREVPRPYDRERDWVREQQHEVERTHERERRWSLSDQRRLEFDRRPLDDRRPPNYDRRPPHLDDKRPLGYVDRRPLDDRRFPPDYDRRPLSEESRFGIAPSQDLPSQGPHIANGNGNGNERRLSVSQAMKTGGPAAAPLTSSSATPSSTAGTAAHAMTPAPMDSAADRDVAGDHRPISVRSSPAPMSVDGQRNSNARFVAPIDERPSSQVASSQDRVSVTQPQLVPRADPTRPGVLLSEGRPIRLPENTGIATPARSAVDNVPHARVSEPPHPERFSISAAPVTAAGAPATDDRSRPVSVAPSSHALSVGRDEPRLQPPPPPRASSPSGVPSAHPSLPLRAREPSRERQPPTFRPSYFRSEFSRPPEDDRRLDVHPLPPPPPGPGDSFRRYDERSRWSPPPYADRRGGYREYYDRDRERERERERAYWDSSKDYRPPPPRDRDRAHPPQSQPPHWDRGRTRYSEPSYASGSGGASGGPADRRFSDERDRDRDRWYPPPASTFDVPPAARRPFDAFLPRGPGPGPRPRSPGLPPPLKRARGDDGYAIPMSVVPSQGPPPPPSLPPSVAAAGVAGMAAAAVPSTVPGPGEYDDYAHQQQVQIPVPIPILRPASRSPPRYGHAHGRPMHMEPYGSSYGAYEREGGGRGPPGAAYAREGPR
ncbi:hypothetical protein EDB92DRAFT_1854688 [Lactarius akahatsu]|uniref:Uncharacterized protein n=1 Tax=Lactarius akahatsu TaxID=416441 RepID=A0AAD4LI15_9AGAM|nr:hypothetical protein EDB92DRAFT_1854688 [Lactarius akahatsu]